MPLSNEICKSQNYLIWANVWFYWFLQSATGNSVSIITSLCDWCERDNFILLLIAVKTNDNHREKKGGEVVKSEDLESYDFPHTESISGCE